MAKHRSQRQLKIGELVRKELAEIFSYGMFKNPELEKFSITISEVRVSPDIRHASVYIMPLGGKEIEKAIELLKEEAPLLGKEIGKRISTKFTPRLKFLIDESYSEAEKINKLILNSKKNS